jgi:hypothetical protein
MKATLCPAEQSMTKFFFDVHNDEESVIDQEGQDLPDFQQARREAQKLLPDIARHHIPNNGDRRAYTVLVRDQSSQLIYSATLVYVGLQLNR